MEETLFGHKQIRQYLNCFSPQIQNKVAKATMILGIQELMKTNERSLQGDFAHLSLEELEDAIRKQIFCAEILNLFEYFQFKTKFILFKS